jgi:hypothetical protein
MVNSSGINSGHNRRKEGKGLEYRELKKPF